MRIRIHTEFIYPSYLSIITNCYEIDYQQLNNLLSTRKDKDVNK